MKTQIKTIVLNGSIPILRDPEISLEVWGGGGALVKYNYLCKYWLLIYILETNWVTLLSSAILFVKMLYRNKIILIEWNLTKMVLLFIIFYINRV